MISQQIRITRKIGAIKDVLDNYYPGENLKVAVEIYNLFLKEETTLDNMDDYWKHLGNED